MSEQEIREKTNAINEKIAGLKSSINNLRSEKIKLQLMCKHQKLFKYRNNSGKIYTKTCQICERIW